MNLSVTRKMLILFMMEVKIFNYFLALNTVELENFPIFNLKILKNIPGVIKNILKIKN